MNIKLGSDLSKIAQATPPEVQVQTNNPSVNEAVQQEQKSYSAQEMQLAQTKRNDQLFTGSLYQHMLASQLATPSAAGKAAPLTPPAPESIGGSHDSLRLGSTGQEVTTLQYELNGWRKQNNLPELSTNGVYNAETEQAVKDFQKSMALPETGIADINTRKGLELEERMSTVALSDQTKNSLRSAFSACQDNPAGRDDIMKLANDQTFCFLLSPDAQSAAVSGYMQAAGQPGQLTDVKRVVLDAAILEKNPSFNKLSEETKRETLNTMFYALKYGDSMDERGISSIHNLATSPQFGRLTQKQQSQLLETIRVTPDPGTAVPLQILIESDTFQNMNPRLQGLVIDVAHSNAIAANASGVWPSPPYSKVADLINLMDDPSFKNATELEQATELIRLKAQMPDDNSIL